MSNSLTSEGLTLKGDTIHTIINPTGIQLPIGHLWSDINPTEEFAGGRVGLPEHLPVLEVGEVKCLKLVKSASASMNQTSIDDPKEGTYRYLISYGNDRVGLPTYTLNRGSDGTYTLSLNSKSVMIDLLASTIAGISVPAGTKLIYFRIA